MSDDDFLKAMADDAVTPLKKRSDKVTVQKDVEGATVFESRRLAALGDTQNVLDPLATLPETLLAPFDELSFVRPGVQHGVFKQLRLGKYEIDARLDLHKHTVDQARAALYQFILDCLENNIRTLLISHGTGAGRETPALLKSCVNHWLPQLQEVLAFHSAQKHHGGYGATYVMLKKGSKEKLRNKALHQK